MSRRDDHRQAASKSSPAAAGVLRRRCGEGRSAQPVLRVAVVARPPPEPGSASLCDRPACPVGEAENGREGRDARPEERVPASCSLAFARWATARRRCFLLAVPLSLFQAESSVTPEAPDDGAVQVALASPEEESG
ncbi:hypothetical protein MTO96_015560 [Rhipicephalus appendiculatus]